MYEALGPIVCFGRNPNQPDSNRRIYQLTVAEDVLTYPVVELNGKMAKAVANVISDELDLLRIRCHGFAIMPDHLHMMVHRKAKPAEDLGIVLKRKTHDVLRESFSEFSEDHKVWTVGRPWITYLDSHEAIWACRRYIDGNPEKLGLPSQKWSFVEHLAPLG